MKAMAVVIAAAALMATCSHAAADKDPAWETAMKATVTPKDNGAALENPGMGWVFHYYDNVPANYGSRLEPSDTVDDYPGLTVVYLRIPWSYIEPEEGRFNWAVVDTPGERWIAKGKQIAFRFSCSESWMRWATPEWVQKAGAKGHNFKPGDGVKPDGPFWEPDYDDPIFLEKLDRFLAAAAARYDGNPAVAFVDVGSFGVWGEGHTYSSTRLPYSVATLRKHIDLHCKHFKKTLLAANDDFASHDRGQSIIDYACEKGLTLRDDSILVQAGKNAYFNAKMAPAFWPKVPVILESEHYGGSRDRGCWQDGSLYLRAVEEYHASYASIHWWPREFLKECRPLIDRMNLRLGYRLQLLEASWPAQIPVGGTWQFNAKWRNAGVAPCLPGGYPAVTFKDAKGGIAGVFVDEGFDMRSLPVGAPDKAEARAQEKTFALPFQLTGGACSVYVSVGTRTGTPRIALPLEGDDGQRRYKIGTVQVTGDYAVRAGVLEKRGGKWLLPLTWTVHRPLPAGVAPFCHFESKGKIAFQGNPPPDAPQAELGKPGVVQLPCAFDVPEKARGGSFGVHVGLWLPERIGQADERLMPDVGENDKRVIAGQLNVGADGEAAFVPKTAP
ncbi:MAG: DUF4832 domain-containing protein [Planctomycetota bacterium]|nr:DUF4832 domain-containing protein [Planctomycetota bacterium]